MGANDVEVAVQVCRAGGNSSQNLLLNDAILKVGHDRKLFRSA